MSNDVEVRKNYINSLVLSEPKTGVLFTDFISQTMARKARRMGESYQSSYKTIINHLKIFSELYSADLYTNSIGEDFLDDFICYLQGRDLKQSYIISLISLVKSMVAKAAKYGYAVDQTYDDVKIKNDEVFSISLSMNDITRIYYFQGLTKKQERIKDLFIVGCLTALRYSDYSTLTRDNFINGYIIKTTKKTRVKVTIPVHDYVREIYEKYNEDISFGLSIQHFNRYIKKICQKVGFIEEIIYSYTRGGKLVTERKQK